MSKGKQWCFNGRTINENQVRKCEAEDYIRGCLLAPFEELMRVLANDQGDWSATATVGHLGGPIVEIANSRADQVFSMLRTQENLEMHVVLVADHSAGVPVDIPIAIELIQTGEGA